MRCGKCGEPWDLDSLHDIISELHYDELEHLREKYRNDPRRHRYDDPFQAEYERKFWNPTLAKFRKIGCELFGTRHNEVIDEDAVLYANAAADLLGDDVDGIEAMLDDRGL